MNWVTPAKKKMAETVQYYLESMIPELELFEKRGIFSKEEIKEIVKKRTGFEYRLKRRIPKELDYIRYAEFEINLETLLRDRIAKLELVNTKDVDQLIIKRIHIIFNRATRKFKGDVNLWLQYFEFAKQFKSFNSISKIYVSALQLHPREVGFWILAASFEYEQNSNMIAARSLMQRGLRINSESKKLWIEYFKLELIYLQKIRQRNEVLGIKNTQAESHHNSIDLNSVPDVSQAVAEEIESLDFSSGAVPLAIFKNAIEAFPDDLDFHTLFISTYVSYFEDASLFYAVLLEHFPNNLKVRGILARRFLDGVSVDNEQYSSKVSLVLKAYNEAIEEFKHPDILESCYEFLESVIVDNPEMKKEIEERLADIFEYADKECFLSEQLFLKWLKLPQTDKLKVANLALKKFPASISLWQVRVSILLDSINGIVDRESLEKILLFLHSATENCTAEESNSLWMMYMTWLKDHADLKIFIESSQRAISHNQSYAANLLDGLLRAILDCDGLAAARSFYQNFMKNNLVSLEFIEHCLKFEQSLPKVDAKVISDLYDKLCSKVPDNQQFWLGRIKHELNCMNLDNAARIYSCALKVLPSKDQFMLEYEKIRLST